MTEIWKSNRSFDYYAHHLFCFFSLTITMRWMIETIDFFFFCACWMRIARYAETEFCIIEYRNNVDKNHKSFEHAFIDNDSRVDDDRTFDHAITSYSTAKRYYYSSSLFVFDVVWRCKWHFDCVNLLAIAINSSNF